MVAGQFIPAHAIDRPELRRELDSALVRPLTLVIAQAGSGKSVLLSQWVASHPEVGCAWVDVYETDDDPSAFVERITRALQTTEPAIESADHSGAMGETVLVLDDLHHLTNLRTLDNLRTLLERLPSHIHVVISSRVDFPMTWTKIRLRNDIGEIRQSALAMNHEESAALLTAITGRELDRASISALLDRTEGWAAGLLLAGMTLRLRHDSAKFIAEFTGSDRLVADYLSEEVLDALPQNDRSALLELSVLDHMSAELIAHLAQSPHGADLLARFERQSMFLIPSDNSRESFRFHQLFRDLLRYRLRAEDPTAEARILARAALWHLKRGESGYAIDYFLRARDWDRALAAISPRGAGVFERGDLVAVAR
ncbi:MAG: AAA family ATPase, partial [Microbacteriaceae bacterium]